MKQIHEGHNKRNGVNPPPSTDKPVMRPPAQAPVFPPIRVCKEGEEHLRRNIPIPGKLPKIAPPPDPYMNTKRFVEKPVVIKAVRIMDAWFDSPTPNDDHPMGPNVYIDPVAREVRITALEGVMTAHAGDWIVSARGGFYVWDDDYFRATYQPVFTNYITEEEGRLI